MRPFVGIVSLRRQAQAAVLLFALLIVRYARGISND
jgi:hypothetical protein|tara:strand:+ start:3758 stop:3865 length:108 start_codon:yes stop_codon:yes gene_type:complete